MSEPKIERLNSGRVVPAQLLLAEGAAFGNFIFLSGQLGNRPSTILLVQSGIRFRRCKHCAISRPY